MKTVVLYGDSITDMCRRRDVDNTGLSFGAGYPIFLKERLIKNDLEVNLINRGCGGDTTAELIQRLQDDVIANKPDIVTILIGVNDVWHFLCEPPHGNTIEKFKENYLYIIHQIKEKCPNCEIFLFGPFHIALKDGNDTLWNLLAKVPNYADTIKEIAKEENLTYTPLQEIFDEANKSIITEEMLYDGIHPNVRGAIMIADKFFETLSPYLK